MTTNNSVDVGLSGSTGSGSFVGSTSPTLTTPTIGAATATSVTFSPTTNGIVGTTTNDNASSGYVGEFLSASNLSSSPITFTTGVAKTLQSITLTAGDWDVWGNIFWSGTTAFTGQAGLNTTTNVMPDNSLTTFVQEASSITAVGVVAPERRFSVSGSTTVYLVGIVSGTGTLNGSGGIYARRVR